MRYNTIVFDLDGTLLNTLEDLTDSVNAILAQNNFPGRTLEEVRTFVGNGVPLLIRRALPNGTDETVYDRCLAAFKTHYAQHMYDKTRPYSGILPLLERLHGMGIQMAIVSNKFDTAVKELCKRFYGDYIQTAIGESENVRKKPAPDSVYAAIRELDAKPACTLYVGDSDVDMQTAKNAGLTSVGVTWGFRDRALLEQEGAAFMIDTPAQLLELVRNAD